MTTAITQTINNQPLIKEFNLHGTYSEDSASGPQIQGFLNYLQQELERRCQKNPRYSLRSFAKFLEIDPSALSKILNGKRPLGKRLIRRFAYRLGLTQEETMEFITHFEQNRTHEMVELEAEKNQHLQQFHERLEKLLKSSSSELEKSAITQKSIHDDELREFGSLVLEAIKLGIIRDHKILQGTDQNIEELGFVLYLQKEIKHALN